MVNVFNLLILLIMYFGFIAIGNAFASDNPCANRECGRPHKTEGGTR